MIAVLESSTPLKQKADVIRLVEDAGFRVVVSEVTGECRIGVVGEGALELRDRLREMPGVREVRVEVPAYPLVSRQHQPVSTRVVVGGVEFGGPAVQVIAGPCCVECREQVLETAVGVAKAGATGLRGGAFKPRTSPYSFQGLGPRALELLAESRAATGLPVVTEVVATEDVEIVAEHADMLQVGARNMQNFRLLQAVGQQPKPVLLKRGMSATLDELLHAAEYVASAGNPRIILCERGIRTFSKETRNTLDISAVPVLKARTHLPVIVDPSHAAGLRELVPALSLSAIAAGADGLIVEVHPRPDEALSDGRQSLDFAAFESMMRAIGAVAGAVGRTVGHL